MYRYTVRVVGESLEFQHEEKSKVLSAKDVVVNQGREYTVTNIVQEPKSVWGFSLPFRATVGIAEAEPRHTQA